MMRIILLVLAFAVSVPAVACDNCLEVLSEIRRLQKQVERRMWESRALETYAPHQLPVLSEGLGSPWSPVTNSSDPEEQVFFQRLEAKRAFADTQDRLDAIKAIVQTLEKDIANEKAALETPPPPPAKLKNLERLENLAKTQRLLVEELERQLAEIHRKFVELDQRIDAHEARIHAFEGDVKSLKQDLRKLAKEIKAHAVSRKDAAFHDVNQFLRSDEGRATEQSRFWQFPRTELRLDDLSSEKVEVTSAVGGNLFGLVKGEAKGGVVYDVHLSTQTFLVAQGTSPLLSRNGATLRDSGLFCTVSKTFTIKGFGSVEANGGFDVGVVKSSTGVKYQRGQTLTATTKRYSEFVPVAQGKTFADQRKVCRQFTAQVARNDDLGAEISSMTRVVQIPESTCYRDYDCRRDVKLGILKPTVISQCFMKHKRQKAVCRHRYVDVNGTCSLPGESVSNFRYRCARGFTCDKQTRKCLRDVSANDWLRSIGLRDARVAELDAHFLAIGPDQDGDKTKYCTTRGRLPEGQGWRLPNKDELPLVARWFRRFAQHNIRSSHKRISAQSWFYPWQANSGLIWSDGPAVYLLSNDSQARFDPGDPENQKAYVDAKSGKRIVRGVGICVR